MSYHWTCSAPAHLWAVYRMNETFLAVFEALYFCCLITCHDMTYVIWKPDALAIMTCHQFGHTHLCLLFVFTFLIFVWFKNFFTSKNYFGPWMTNVTKNDMQWQGHNRNEKWQSFQFQLVVTNSKKMHFSFFHSFQNLINFGKSYTAHKWAGAEQVQWYDMTALHKAFTWHMSFVTWHSDAEIFASKRHEWRDVYILHLLSHIHSIQFSRFTVKWAIT